MKKWHLFLLVSLLLVGCGQDPLAGAQKSRLTSQSSSSTALASCRSNSGVVCGQPPMPTCPEGMMCAQVMPQPQNYDNECVMQQAGARLLNLGSCAPSTP